MKDEVFVNISDVIKVDNLEANNIQILAHTSDNKKNETLHEHTVCCEKYFKRIIEDRKLHNIVENFSDTFFSTSEEKAKYMFKKLLANIVVFHDFGKINPAYQNKLKNKNYIIQKIDCLNGETHSMLSAVIYFDYFMNEINMADIDDKTKSNLKYLVFLNSYIISRHHGNLAGKNEDNPIEQFSQKFSDGGEAFSILKEMDNGKFVDLYNGSFLGKKKYIRIINNSRENFYQSFNESIKKEIPFYIYAYIKFIYSILISCDYYATCEYKNGVEIRDYGNLNEIDEINSVYENTNRIRSIRNNLVADDGENINFLRNAMFMESENNLLSNKDKRLFFLEAPTGSGKSNMSVNISLKLLNETIRKIIYVYPFNTLVEQNLNSLKDIFKGSSVLEKIAVVNSIYPLKRDIKEIEQLKENENEEKFYQKILLDRQFLNYPFILTTHVNLFDVMFGCSKESACNFYQLSNSVIVLDEIQSYKNDIWTEIMYFLQCFSNILNIKVVIMSATLPRMDCLTDDYLSDINREVVPLINKRNDYFEDKRFKDRVKLSFELLNFNIGFEELSEHILNNFDKDTNIVVEFIKKNTTYDFYDYLNSKNIEGANIYCITGDYNQSDREQILKAVSSSKGNILVATQVVEAGVDIDMDIGYKNISKLDSEEQFIGRINRNYLSKYGYVFFFYIDDAKRIYNNDFRIEPEFTIKQPEMQEILKNKRFDIYYQKILQRIKTLLNERLDERGTEAFINDVKYLKFFKIQERMQLINGDDWNISVFIPRIILLSDGREINGFEIWENYKQLLMDNEINYAEKQVKLSDIKSNFNYFIFKINCNKDIYYNDRIGEIYFLEDGEKYIKNGHLSIDENAMFL